MNQGLRTLGVVALVVAAAAGGFFFARYQRADVADSASAQAIPAQVPNFVLKDTDEVERTNADWAGKSLIVNFWATWCPPCLREIPLLNTLQTQRAPANFQIVGIAIDRPDDVRAYMKKVTFTYPVLIGEQDALDLAERFGVGSIGLPFTVFADNRGRIVTLRLGELDAKDANGILDVVASVNEEKLTLDQAKERIRKLARHH